MSASHPRTSHRIGRPMRLAIMLWIAALICVASPANTDKASPPSTRQFESKYVLIALAHGSDEDDIEDKVEDKVEEDIEDKVEDDIEDKVEEDIEDKIEDDIEDIDSDAEDKIAEELADQAERKLKMEEDIQREIEDAEEDRRKLELELLEEVEEAAEDRLEDEQDRLEDEQDRLDKAEEELRDERDRDGSTDDNEDNSGPGNRDDDDEDDDNSGPGDRDDDDLDDENEGSGGQGGDQSSQTVNRAIRSLVLIEQQIDREGNPVVRGELLVLVDDEQSELIRAAGYELTNNGRLESLGVGFYKVELPVESELDQAAMELAALVGEDAVDVNHIYSLDQDTLFGSESDVGDLRTPSQLALSLGLVSPLASQGKIGVIDTGIDANHPCLNRSQIVENGFDAGGASNQLDHGTAIASILIGQSGCGVDGLLQGVSLYNAAVFFETSEGTIIATAEGLLRGLDWLIQSEVSVINLSLSGPSNRLVHRAIATARRNGLVIVAAAGNQGPLAQPQFPAGYEEAVAVTAVDENDHVFYRAGRGAHIEFAAPGVDVVVADQYGIAARSGTSIATPFVSAIIFAQLQIDPDRSREIDATLSDLRRMARDLGQPGPDPIYGYGLIRFQP